MYIYIYFETSHIGVWSLQKDRRTSPFQFVNLNTFSLLQPSHFRGQCIPA